MISWTAWRVAVCGPLVALMACSQARAAFVGDYFFPSTLATTVPTAADFLNPPYFVKLSSTAATREIDIPTTYSKLITSNWSITATETYRILNQTTGTRSGFDNLVVGTQYQFYTDAQHQFVTTIGGTAAIGGTGASNIANAFTTLTPTIYMGKGFGDLPASMAWLRPVGVTAQVGVSVPTQSTSPSPVALTAGTLPFTTLSTVTLPGPTSLAGVTNPSILLWSFALEYNLTQTHSERGSKYALGWFPVVEFAFQTPLTGATAGQTTGTINPGIIWVGRYLQVAVEAIAPINSASGHDIGVRAQAHLYFSAIFPDSLGKPIFGK